MKNIAVILLLVFFHLISLSQQSDNCILLINGKQFINNSKVPKDDLLKLCLMQLSDTRVNKILKPISFQWVVSIAGQIVKGDLTTCSKLTEAVNKMQSDDILFVEEIKYKGVAGLCAGQFALTLE
ncbi:MAG: hypothetical protein V4615_13175 [Bacteroidota bacterium]